MPVRFAFGPSALARGASDNVMMISICPLAWLSGFAVEGVGGSISEGLSPETLVWPSASDADSVAAPTTVAARSRMGTTGCIESSFGQGGLNPRGRQRIGWPTHQNKRL